MFVDVLQPFPAIEELIHPRCRWQSRIGKTKGAVPSYGENSAMCKRVAPDWKRFQVIDMLLAVVVPGFGAKRPFTTVKAQLCKAIVVAANFLIARICMSPVVRGVRIIEA